jgi:hypothetical protein
MQRGGKDSKGQREVEGSLGSPLHRMVEEDGISKLLLFASDPVTIMTLKWTDPPPEEVQCLSTFAVHLKQKWL